MVLAAVGADSDAASRREVRIHLRCVRTGKQTPTLVLLRGTPCEIRRTNSLTLADVDGVSLRTTAKEQSVKLYSIPVSSSKA